VFHKWSRAEKAGPSTPATTAPNAGAKIQVVAFAQDDTIYETSSIGFGQLAFGS
jgi:hypothetical protein